MRHLIHKELKDMFRQGLFQVGALAVLLLMVAAMAISYRYQAVVEEQLAVANEAARERWENQGERNQHAAAHFGMYLFKPQSALSWWDHGVEAFTGVSVYAEAHKRNPALYKPVQDSPSLATWGELTPAFVMLFLLPLLAIWLSYGQIAGEKEAGTYRLVMSQGISPRKWMIAKAAAVWLALLALVLPTYFVGAALLGGGAEVLSLRGMLLLGVYLLYLGIFIHLTLALSARLSQATPVLVGMLGLWVLGLWVVPKLSAQAAEKLFPTPTGQAFQAAIHEDIQQEGIPSHAPPTPKKKRVIQAMLTSYGVDRPEDLPVNFNGLRLQASEDANDPIVDRHHQRLYAQYARQERVQALAGLLSPFTLARRLSMGLCQTDVWSQVAFAEASEQHRRTFVKLMNEDIIAHGEAGTSWNVSASRELWESVPAFDPKPSRDTACRVLTTFFQRYALSLGLLLGWFGLAVGLWWRQAS